MIFSFFFFPVNFDAEACFVTRQENEWYKEPVSSKASLIKDTPPELASPVE